jgi:hypothetical protein
MVLVNHVISVSIRIVISRRGATLFLNTFKGISAEHHQQVTLLRAAAKESQERFDRCYISDSSFAKNRLRMNEL